MIELSTLSHQFNAPQNRLYALRERLLRQKTNILDLTSGNVTAHEIQFPETILRRVLARATRQTRTYQPEPMGHPKARRAISQFYRREGLPTQEDHLLLTPGTSISYWYVLKVLANPHDEILVPAPSYPLFDAIAEISQVKLVPYRLREGLRWAIDFDQMEASITARTRAVILISPHNPTGAVATDEEVRALGELAGRHHLAVISDEVFSPFVYTEHPLPRPAKTRAPLVFTLNGLSKMLALPGLKIGWILVSGDPSLVKKSIRALEMFSDTFLPVNEMAQAALPSLLSESRRFQHSYFKKLKERRDLAAHLLQASPAEGGFFMTLPLRAMRLDEEELACRVLEKHHILLHPGYFYAMPGRHLVLSFASQPKRLEKALRSVISELKGDRWGWDR